MLITLNDEVNALIVPIKSIKELTCVGHEGWFIRKDLGMARTYVKKPVGYLIVELLK